MFDFAENLIAQQRAFAKQMLHAASKGQQAIADAADSTAEPERAPRAGPAARTRLDNDSRHFPGRNTGS